jgi:hypothetical protein
MNYIKTVLGRGFVIVGQKDKKDIQVKRIDILNSRISELGRLCPFEFDRIVTTTKHVTSWKATSYRQFFLYLAYPLLEDLLDEKMLRLVRYFQYFFYLIGGADPSPVPDCDLDFAQEIIEFWVSSLLHLSNGTAAKPSIHFMLHVVEDCRFHKCHFDVLSAFIYENSLRYVKNDIVSGNMKLEQLRNRMVERTKYAFNRDEEGHILRTESGDVSMGWNAQVSIQADGVSNVLYEGKFKYKRLTLPDFQINTSMKDSFVLVRIASGLRAGSHKLAIVQILDFVEKISDKSLSVRGYVYKDVESLFVTPADSKLKHVYVFSGKSSRSDNFFPISSIVAKLYVIPRFSKLGVQMATPELLGGHGFLNVIQWVGIALRHIVGNKASLY